jgi:hypothetical protein
MLVAFKRRCVMMREGDMLCYYFRQQYKRKAWLVFRQADTQAGLVTRSEWYIGYTVLVGGQWLFFQSLSKQTVEQWQLCAIKIMFIPIHTFLYSTKSEFRGSWRHSIRIIFVPTQSSKDNRMKRAVKSWQKILCSCWLVYKILYSIIIIVFSRLTLL